MSSLPTNVPSPTFPALLFLLLIAPMSVAPAVTPASPNDGRNAVLGRPTDRSVTLSVLSEAAVEICVHYGTASGAYTEQTPHQRAGAGIPCDVELEPLKPNTRYWYRIATRPSATDTFRFDPEGTFHTARASGVRFSFALQGDSHPEREGKMFDRDLYVRTMHNVAIDRPDFYLTLGDDFSIERLIERQTISQASVDRVYALQRAYLGIVGRSSALFLVNGNHEQAARYLLNGSDDNPAVCAGRARTRFFPLPAPDAFYSGDAEPVEHVGLLRDYYAWTWGDALFVVIDPYWHSPGAVDNEAGIEGREGGKRANGGKRGVGRRRDLWEITLGDAQYRWLTETLTHSNARWKFVFCHHVLGTGRGGVEQAGLYEWGGRERNGAFLFNEKRPGWDLPIHDLMVKAGVTIVFQGHDHLYARQELDGIVYQTCPNPADRTYQAFNREAYRSGDILPNAGHMRVAVAPESVRVDYVRSVLDADEREGLTNAAVARTYTIVRQRKRPSR